MTTLILLLLSAQSVETAVNDQGNLVRDGKEVFLFGIYHTSWFPDPSRPDKRPRRFASRDGDLLEIHRNGLNSILVSLDPTSPGKGLPKGYRTGYGFLEAASERGIGIIPEIYLPSMGLLIDRMKESPAILAWQIADDFNVSTGNNNYTDPETMRKRNALAKKHDPKRVTYASGGTALVERYRDFKDYHGTVDLVGMQSYPVGNEVDFPVPAALERHYRIMKARVAQLAGSRMVPIANLQSFAWDEKKPKNPTASETRNMLYAALDAGSKGVLYYTYYHGKKIDGKVTLPGQDPTTWAEIGRLGKEVKAIERFLLAGDRKTLKTRGKLHASVWTRGAERLLLVFSTERKKTLEASLNVEGSGLEPLFEGRPGGLTLAEGRVTGRVGPEDVHVYRVRP